MLVRQIGLPVRGVEAEHRPLVVGDVDAPVVEAGAGFDRARRVELPEDLAVGGAQGGDVGLVGADVERGCRRPSARIRGGSAGRWSTAVLPLLRVDRDQPAVDVGEEDEAAVVDGRGDVGRRAGVPRVGDPFPEHLAVAQPHRFRVAELVDDVGDAVGERRRELDQRVGVDRPGFAQGRVEGPAVRPAGSGCARGRGRRAASRRAAGRPLRARLAVAVRLAGAAAGGERQAAGEGGQK